MSRLGLEYLQHIVDETEYLLDRTQDLTKEDYIGQSLDENTTSAAHLEGH